MAIFFRRKKLAGRAEKAKPAPRTPATPERRRIPDQGEAGKPRKRAPETSHKIEKELTKPIVKVEPTPVTNEMRSSYLDYAMSVIVSRALPDVRDGLKPVHRRILFVCHESGLSHSAKAKKSAAIIGDTLGRYHPHGDQAVYDAMARMAQDFSLRYPLIEGQGNWGCFTKDTKVKLCDGRNLSFEGLIKEQEDGKKHWTFTFNPEAGKIEITEIRNPRLTRKNEKIMEVALDNGDKVRCTLDHRFMVRDGAYKQAKDLKPGDSLMPLYAKLYNDEDKNLKGYETIYQPTKNEWEFVHHLADAWNLKHKIYTKSAGRIRHHQDFNKLNNNPDNILRIQWQDHWKHHKEIASSRHKNDPEYVRKLAEGRRRFIENNRHIFSLRAINLNKKLWGSPEFRKKHSQHIKELWQDSEYKKYMRQASSKNLKNLWKRKDFQKLLSKLKSEEMKKRWQEKEYRSYWQKKMKEISRKIWSDPNHREYISTLMKEKSQDPAWRERQSKIAKALWRDPEYRAKYSPDHFSKMANELWKDPKTKKLHREKAIRQWQNPEFREKFITGVIAANRGRIEKVKEYNHKVIRIKILKKREDVYDLTTEPWHNFALAAGIFVHNSIDGDPPAAYRYTEARMTSLSQELLADIEKNTVDFRDNYDGTKKEPIVLPSKIPHLLLNGSMGIAVGMATNIPPHNLGELCDGIIALLDRPTISLEELVKIIPGPDFPTGGIIYGQEDLLQALSTGRGPVVTRGKAEIQGEEGKYKIIITEIPYQVNKAQLVERIADLAKDKKIEGIKDLRDESSKEGIRVVIELKRDAYPKNILNRLYTLTQLQETFHVNSLALVDGIEPKLLNLKTILEEFLKHRKIVVRRRTEYILLKTKERLHILEGLKIAILHLDKIIKLIKSSEDKEDAKTKLMKNFRLSEIQALAILAMRLGDLAKLETTKLEQEYQEKKKLAAELEKILKGERGILKIIQQETLEIKQKYADPRRTAIVPSRVKELSQEDLIPNTPCLILITRGGYIKRMTPETFKTQGRGGKGVVGVTPKEEDVVEKAISTNTHANLFFFTTRGKTFCLKAYEVPESSRQAKGSAIVNFIELGPGEKVSAVLFLSGKEIYKYLVMSTKAGLVKKTEISAFDNVRRTGLIAINLKKDDELIFVKPSDGKSDILLTTANGQAIHFKETDIRAMGRTAAGVRGIRLKKEDKVVGLNIISQRDFDSNLDIFVLMEKGFGKRTKFSLYKKQRRGGSGIKTAKITSKTGGICQTRALNLSREKEGVIGDLLIVSHQGQIIRLPSTEIPRLGRSTQGVRLMRFKEQSDSVASATLV